MEAYEHFLDTVLVVVSFAENPNGVDPFPII
jgi:hypothetical protein